ncbi:hypothetical protein AXX17_AT2G00390 [Arabidopsis thaliana]|uniref:Uncharacterized protein n=1 Tax=Arabidopsis thaliana TaxID=3702 RepID=A0A178VRC2_ARATH|nr:hypothetical protein AXX17_AT2G00390 [Arabidopsis thaliana]
MSLVRRLRLGLPVPVAFSAPEPKSFVLLLFYLFSLDTSERFFSNESDLADPSKAEAFLSKFSPQTSEIPPEDPDLVLSFMRLSLLWVSG